MNHWFQRRHRRCSRVRKQPQKQQQRHPEKDDDAVAVSDTVAKTTITTTTSKFCSGLPTDTRRTEHLRLSSFSHRVRQQQLQQQQQPQQQRLQASGHNDMKKNRAVYIKTGNHLYNDIEYYEYTIPSFQRQGPKQATSSSLQQQQQQQQRSSPPTSPTAASSLGSSLSSVCSSSYADAAAETTWNHRNDDYQSKRILSEFALSAYLTADCSLTSLDEYLSTH